MDIKTTNYPELNEALHMYRHPSGLKAFVIPKKGYSKKYAVFATHYGSINNMFIVPGEKDMTAVPDGIAHFLEHKLFEQKDGSIMDKFSALGANPNAYTSFNQTAYLFSCTDKFNENFRLLLDFVQNPYITKESVEKEKNIIGQEINMYEDDPGWRVFFNLLGAFYKNNPVKIDIAGTIESISKINKDILYKCYNTFYHPSNMVILVVGDVNTGEVFGQVESGIESQQSKPGIKRVFPDEAEGVQKDYVELSLAVSMPMFQMGFKDSGFSSTGLDCLKQETAVKLLLEMIMGKSSGLYSSLYGEGLINSSFDFDYTIEESYAFSMFGGESPEPEKVRDRIIKEITELKKRGLGRENFERIRKSMKGRFIKQLNSVERISHMFIPIYFKNAVVFDYYEVYDKITFEYINEIFEKHFNLSCSALSVVKPA